MASLRKAIALLQQGEWQAAHVIVQHDETAIGYWAHGLVHLLEGDTGNARYWYRKAKRAFPRPDELNAELSAIAAAVPTGTKPRA